MKLSKRLQTICDFVPENKNTIDVGCDHALVDIYLNKYKNCNCLATDISKKCIEKANENIKKHQALVQTKVTNGLENINLSDQIIIISGMGTKTILEIINKKITNDLIISTHNNIPLLKKILYKKGYRVYKETVIYDKKYYVITYYKYKKGKKTNPYTSPYYNKEYYQFLLDKYKNIYEKNHKLKYKIILLKIKKVINKS